MKNPKFEAYFKALKGKRIAVVGYGVSNRPLIPFLLDAGANVTVYDKKNAVELGPAALADQALGVSFVGGEGYLERAEGDVLFRSPGIHPARLAGKAGLLTSEAEAFFEVAPCPIIGITGSDGKSTTTTLISKFTQAAGIRTFLGGNIGTPLMPLAGDMTPEDIAVMELSSFQLMTMTRSPHVAVVTNVAPNHLDIHKDMQEYIDAKKHIFLHKKPGDRLVVNLDNPITAGFEAVPGAFRAGFSLSGKTVGNDSVRLLNGKVYRGEEEMLTPGDILIPGRHNVDNYMAAMAATAGIASRADILPVAQTFGGVVHRLELCRTLNGVRYYNSSIDSSPTRTNAALSVFSEKVIVILGGYDKHLPFEPLHDPVNAHAAGVILTGDTAQKINAAIGDGLPREWASDMADAVSKARTLDEKTGSHIILLSPACASFDRYKNFEERGNLFKKIVGEL